MPGLGIASAGYTAIMVSNSDGANTDLGALAGGVRRIERATALDGPAKAIGQLVRPISEGRAGPGLRGNWLGHLSFGRRMGLGERWASTKDPVADDAGGRHERHLSEDHP